jgi:hypothetical protein
MAANTPLCNWTVDETLEFMIDIGAVVKNDNGYTSGWSEDMRQWSKNRVCLAIAKKCGYHSKHTVTLRNLVDRTSEEFNIRWDYQGRWVFEKTLAKEVSEITGYDIDDLNMKDWHRAVSYFSGLKKSGASSEKIERQMKAYIPKIFKGIKDVRRCRINSRRSKS